MTKLKVKSEFVTKKNIKDLMGMTISKGTKVFVIKDDSPVHPTHGYKMVIVRIDNGTGDLSLMPETAIKEKGGVYGGDFE